VHPASAYFDHEQDVQAAQKDRVEVEKVAGQQPVGLAAQEHPPRGVRIPWRGTMPMVTQDPPDGRLTQAMAQTQEFAVHSPISPLRVLSREPVDQLADLLGR
jgi:hypothetical protein